MPKYSFIIKKRNYQIEMTSDDGSFAGRQLDKLFSKLFNMEGKVRVVLPPIEPEKAKKEITVEPIKQDIIEKEPAEEVIQTKEVLKAEEKQTVKPVEEPVKTVEPASAVEEKPVQVKKEPPIKLPEEDVIIPEKQKSGFISPEIKEPEVIIKPIDVVSEEDEEIAKILEEKIKKSLPFKEMPVIEIEEPEEEEISTYKKQPIPVETIKTEALEDEVIMEFNSFQDLVKYKRPQTKLEYLLWAAYYLQNKEDIYKFSLKQVNSKIMPFLGTLIDHSVIHEAVSNNFVEVVPDYNGTADVTEYKLTLEGENYLFNEL